MYESRVHGEIAITPPLSPSVLEARSFHTQYDPDAGSVRDVRVRLEDVPVPGTTDTFRRCITAIVPASDDWWPSQNVSSDVQLIVDLAQGRHRFTGYLECVGAEAGDVERIAVTAGNQVVTIKPTWEMPVGSEG